MVFLLAIFNIGSLDAADKITATPEDLIRKLYDEHQPQNNKEISFEDTNALSHYFTAEIVTLFLRDKECRERTNQYYCNLSSDPLLYAQDYDNSPRDLEIKKYETKRMLSSYSVTFTNMRHRTTLIYEVRKTKDGWRISDIIYPTKDRLSNILSQPQ
jgi:hypothetical protein